jgi:[acyl-carrier-protein] S-malonyltransferase
VTSPGPLIFMFPGQSSRYPQMIEKLTAESAASAAIVGQASAVLGRDLGAHYRSGNDTMFARNRDVQIGIFLANHLHMRWLEEAGIEARWSLGLSLGEYNHLVHAGALSFEDALRLVDQRGVLYENGAPGMMMSVFPIEAEIVNCKIAELGLEGRVVIGLYNSPRQQVLSGERDAVVQLTAALEEDMLIEPVETEPNIPMHAPTFAPVAEKFRSVLAKTRIEDSRLPYIPNVLASIMANAPPDTIRTHLASHVCKPVFWQSSIDALASRLPAARFVEVGPRAVLYNLFGRGWMPGRRYKTDAGEHWPEHIRGLIADLRNGG